MLFARSIDDRDCSCPPVYQCFGKGFSPGALRRFIERRVLGDGPPQVYDEENEVYV